MKLRTTGAAALAATLGLAALTACGSTSSRPSANGTVTGAPAGSSAASVTASSPASASAQVSVQANPQVPSFDIPADVVIKAEGFTDGDPVKGEVLRDLTYEIQAWSEANAKGDATVPVFQRYFTGLGAGAATDNLQAFRKSGRTVTGTDVFYQPTVALGTPTSGGATYCEDQSRFYGKELSTGKVLTSTPSVNDFVRWSVGLEKNSRGDWQVTRAQWTHGVADCRR